MERQPDSHRDEKRLAVPLAPRVAATTVVAVLLSGAAAIAGVDPPVVAGVFTAGVFAVGVVLWWWGFDTPRKLDEIGRTIMVSVVLAVVVGLPQYLFAERQKERDFRLSLTLQDDLSGAALAGRDLSDIMLRAKKLRYADLSGARLRDAQLARTDFTGANFADADLRGADLRGANLEAALLADADMRGATLKDGKMMHATLDGADLRGADLEITELTGSCFADADLRGARLAGADLTEAVLTAADVRGAIFESDLRPAVLRTTGLTDVVSDATTRWPIHFMPEWAISGVAPARDAPPVLRPKDAIRARVLHAVDGDTLRVQASTEDWRRLLYPGRLRLIGLDAPDPDDEGGPRALRYLQRHIEGRTVDIQLGRDPVDDGGRNLAYVWLSRRRTLNERLLTKGYASLEIGTNHEFEEQLHEAQLMAKRAGRGLWRTCPVPGGFERPEESE